MVKEEIDGDRIFLIRDFLSVDECSALIERSESLGYGSAPLGDVVVPDYRNNSRVIANDPVLATTLFDRARPLLTARVDDMILAGLNEQFRFYRYAPGQSFKPHRDGRFERIEVWEESWFTFMVYLTGSLDGGETKFFGDGTRAAEGDASHVVRPESGMALVFRHEIWHEGAEVRDGLKYVLRSDVLYAPDRAQRATLGAVPSENTNGNNR